MRQWILLLTISVLTCLCMNAQANIQANAHPSTALSTSAALKASSNNNKVIENTPDGKVYRIGVVESVPFTSQKQDGVFQGFVTAIWREVAEDSGINYHLINAGDNSQVAVQAMKAGKFDGLIGPISVTTSRLRFVSFSRPFFLNKLSAVSLKPSNSFWKIVLHMLAAFFAWSIFTYFILLLIFSFLHYLLERHYSVDEYNHKFYKSFIYSFWVNTIALLANDYQQKPKSPGARLVMVFWMLISVVFLAELTATLTSALTISKSNLDLSGKSTIKSLYQRNIAVQAKSYAVGSADRLGASLTVTKNLGEAFDLLKENKVNAVLGNYLTLKYYVRANIDKDFEPNPIVIGANEMAFAFPKNSALLEPVNFALTKLQDNNVIHGICEKYLNFEDSASCVI